MAILSKSRTDELISLLPSKEAETELVYTNIALVKLVVNKYFWSNSKEEYEDLVSAGTIGLIKAVRSFDPNNRATFSTYATKCISNEVCMFLRKQKRHGKNLSLDELFDGQTDRSLKMTSSVTTLSPFRDMEEEVLNKIFIQQVYEAMEKLKPIDKEIVELWFGLNGKAPMNQKDIARKFGFTQSYISRKVRMSMKILRNILED